jgi:nitrogen fixation/metabolism regulation signal transduction histidine kinase
VKQRHRARFRYLVVAQIILLLLTLGSLVWTILETAYTAVPLVIVLVILFQVVGLIRSVESHVDTLEDFFSAVNYEDFTRRFIEDDIDAELKESFNRVLQRFQDARAERDVQAGYLETVVRHVPVPFIAARSDGTLSLVNNPARRLTGLTGFSHIDQLADVDPTLPDKMRRLESGSQQLLQARLRGVPAELRVSVSEIRLEGDMERLYSIENLSGELTARESAAWRNLIRVLTHEIMNTLTPVTSLAQTTAGMLHEESAHPDIEEAIKTIARRAEGLTNFVLRYRELLQVPQPNPAEISIAGLLNSAVTLMSADNPSVTFDVDVSPKTLQVHADAALLDQVLVNVIRNALDAVAGCDDARIALTASLDYGRVVIRIRDNGDGIAADTLDQVFVPFFTTKREGSGIGLSLCRQIMTAHGGEIALEGDGRGTIVTLIF